MSAHQQTVPLKQPATSHASSPMSVSVVETRPSPGATYILPLPVPYHPGQSGDGWADAPHVPTHRTLPPISAFTPREAHSQLHEADKSYNYSTSGLLTQRVAQRPALRGRQSSGSLDHILLHPPGDGPASPHVSPISAGRRQPNVPNALSANTSMRADVTAPEILQRETRAIRQVRRGKEDNKSLDYSPVSSESSVPKRGQGRPSSDEPPSHADLEGSRSSSLPHARLHSNPARASPGNL